MQVLYTINPNAVFRVCYSAKMIKVEKVQQSDQLGTTVLNLQLRSLAWKTLLNTTTIMAFVTLI